MKRRIGILTSGGDCPGLNAAIRGVAKAAYEMFDDLEIVGIGGDGQLWEEIRMGNITGTVCPDTRALTDAVVRAASGREVQQVTLAELIRVTRENTDQFLGG